jgi:hypothetical protein
LINQYFLKSYCYPSENEISVFQLILKPFILPHDLDLLIFTSQHSVAAFQKHYHLPISFNLGAVGESSASLIETIYSKRCLRPHHGLEGLDLFLKRYIHSHQKIGILSSYQGITQAMIQKWRHYPKNIFLEKISCYELISQRDHLQESLFRILNQNPHFICGSKEVLKEVHESLIPILGNDPLKWKNISFQSNRNSVKNYIHQYQLPSVNL